MSRAQAENVIKNIIREIAQDCATKGQAVSETLVAFMVKAVVLDPTNEFNVDRTLTKEDVQKLIRVCVERLLDTKSPGLDTIKMQVYFDMNYTTRSDFLDEHRRVLESRLQPVIREITDTRARSRDELESLYRKVVSVVLLRSGLGSPTDIIVVREATAALQSVFPHTELGLFVNLAKNDKERQLKELTLIVTGIRLFNKECGKGGDGIDDLPAILNEALPATTTNMHSELQSTLQKAYLYCAVLEDMIRTRHKDKTNMTLMKEALINSRQHEVFLKIIIHDTVQIAEQLQTLQKDFSQRMQSLHATVQAKTAVPTAQVYPQFVHLAQLWSQFQDNMVLLSVLSNILVSLEPYTRTHRELFTEDSLKELMSGVKIKNDQQRMESTNTAEHKLDMNKEEIRRLNWLFSDNTKNFNRLTFQYKGYCPWALVACDRLLIPGNPNIGVLNHNNNYYCFSSRGAAEQFALNADKYIMEVTEVAKKSPELIQLLELHEQFSTIAPYSTAYIGKMIDRPIGKLDAEVQTEIHPIEFNIVKSHEWNEWELRRKAIRLTNLRNKVTHSMQTDLSHMRRSATTQIYPSKDNWSQTRTTVLTNVPKPQMFLANLRGIGLYKETNMVRVDLTRDVGE